MINTLAAMHAATRARKQADTAKALTVEVRKRRRFSAPTNAPHAPSSNASEKADD